ncbi:MAG: hypothetical protein FJY88_07655 [Candidatus Eisenbacteria bacterium]|nr:hypothetical protein [Candidatus Eisenbacteria bacterium]
MPETRHPALSPALACAVAIAFICCLSGAAAAANDAAHVVLYMEVPTDSVEIGGYFTTRLLLSAGGGSPRKLELRLDYDRAVLRFEGASIDPRMQLCPDCQADARDTAQGTLYIRGVVTGSPETWNGPPVLLEMRWLSLGALSGPRRAGRGLALMAMEISSSDGRPVEVFALSRSVPLKKRGTPEAEETDPMIPIVTGGPNPFSATTSLSYELRQPAEVTLEIFDLGGRLMRRLMSPPAVSGPQRLTWDGRDDEGNAVAAGVYGYRLGIGSRFYSSKLTVLR